MMMMMMFMCQDKAVWDERAAARVQPLLHQQLSCACTVTSEHESVFVCSTRACCTCLLQSFLIFSMKCWNFLNVFFYIFFQAIAMLKNVQVTKSH